MSRTGQQRLDAISKAVEDGGNFRALVAAAEGDVVRCADLMAEAVDMHRAQRGLEPVGRDGRLPMTVENLEAMYCLDAARAAYGRARRSNTHSQQIVERTEG